MKIVSAVAFMLLGAVFSVTVATVFEACRKSPPASYEAEVPDFVALCGETKLSSERESRVYCACVDTFTASVTDNYSVAPSESSRDSIVGQCLSVARIRVEGDAAGNENL